MKIKDVADRSGFSAAALRYYEQIGLLPEPARTPSGYRSYDERTLERLAFIARTKQLGCTLAEIIDLTTAWDGGSCGPIQDRLRAVVAHKLVAARAQSLELATLSTELQQAATSLELHRPDGPCDDRCGCVGDPNQGHTVGDLTDNQVPDAAAIPIACTLGPSALRGQLEDWAAILAYATRRLDVEHGMRVELSAAAPLDELVRLVAAEQDCCQFLRFAITVDARGTALEVTAPAGARSIVDALFGAQR